MKPRVRRSVRYIFTSVLPEENLSPIQVRAMPCLTDKLQGVTFKEMLMSKMRTTYSNLHTAGSSLHVLILAPLERDTLFTVPLELAVSFVVGFLS
jgi:hypothetical protein